MSKRGDFSISFPPGRVLEYDDEDHIYLCDGVIIPSVSQIVRASFPDKYAGVAHGTLQAAAERGTAIHGIVEGYVNYGVCDPLTDELRGYRFLERTYNFKAVMAEIPLLYCEGDTPIFAGRMDLLIHEGNKNILADIKSTATLDKRMLAVQLNLYRIAFEQCYSTFVDGLRGIHLRGKTRKYVEIPMDENIALQAIKNFKEIKE